jgi:hypothetical protein
MTRECIDVCHDYWGDCYEKYNDCGDAFLVMNVFILLVSLPYCCQVDVARIFGLYMALMVFREAVSLVTRCEACVNKDHRPWLGGDDRWYVISGHLATSILVTYLVYNSDVMKPLKITSVLLCFCVFFIQIATREHYTKDMMVTALIGWLLIKAYG